MTNIKTLIGTFLIIFLFFSCDRDEILEGKYARPEWLAGKLYDQILEQSELSTFAKCLELTGYDEIINVSGSYTVFAPSNDAFNAFFSNNPNYSSLESIPADELSRIVKYHIVQNPWTKLQLRSLDVFGWIDTLDVNNNEPRGFKRATLLLEGNRKYGVSSTGSGSGSRTIIVDTLNTGFHRINVTDSRKYAPVFFQEYFDIYDLNKNDYEFYFNRTFESSNDIYFVNAKIESEEIFAENGLIYIIDRVVEPLKTAYQIIEDTEKANQYTDFLNLLNTYPEFNYNQRETFNQPGVDQGIQVDSLFDLTYPELLFDINNERTKAPRGTFGLPQNVTIRYHHGLIAPTNSAFQDFLNSYLRIPQGWQNLENAPNHIKRLIARTYMSYNPIYPTDFEKGFYNGEEDIVRLQNDNIVEKRFGSNATFIGLNEAIVPRAFSSVTGPIYLRQGYRKVMFAIEASGLLPALKRENRDYALFVESDANTDRDSSFFYNGQNFSAIEITGGGFFERVGLTTNDLRNLILNHVAIRNPKGIAKKEFIPNLAGNYLIFNNETGEVSGTAETTYGYKGSVVQPNFPRLIDFGSDNGSTYDIDNWFSFSTSDIYTIISSRYPVFHNLLRTAGLALDKEFRYTFISNNESYTIFVPSQSALENEDFSSFSTEELRRFLMLHFVRGQIIFTDGSTAPGYYNTERVDERSTPFTPINTQIYIEPGYDIIKLRRVNGIEDIEILDSETSNRLAGVRDAGSIQAAYPSMFNNAVIHEIDQVLKVEELDTK